MNVFVSVMMALGVIGFVGFCVIVCLYDDWDSPKPKRPAKPERAHGPRPDYVSQVAQRLVMAPIARPDTWPQRQTRLDTDWLQEVPVAYAHDPLTVGAVSRARHTATMAEDYPALVIANMRRKVTPTPVPKARGYAHRLPSVAEFLAATA